MMRSTLRYVLRLDLNRGWVGKRKLRRLHAPSECKPPTCIGWFGDVSHISQTVVAQSIIQAPLALVSYDSVQTEGKEEIKI